MKKFILPFCIGASIIGLVGARKITSTQPLGARPTKKMNVIFYLVDDMGWSDVGYEGSRFYDTPVIDSFARQGVRFTHAYAACHVCSPTRASILTGEYPARTHLTDWLPGRKDFPFQKLKNVRSAQHLPYDQPTLPRVLKENGYATAIFGKWHLGWDDTTYAQSPLRQGFDLHIPDWDAGWPNGSYFAPFGLKGLDDGTTKGAYLSDVLTDKAVDWVKQHRYQPFFLYFANYAVHDPIQGRGDLVLKYKRKLNQMRKQNELPSGPDYILEENPDDPQPLSRDKLTALLQDRKYQDFSLLPNRTVKIRQHQTNPIFAAMVEAVDESLAKILAELKQLGLDDNTIIIFFSDNGGMSGANFGNPRRIIEPCDLDEAYSTSNLPLRGGKGWLYEGGIREPLIIYWPNEGNHGAESDVPVISTDFYATILDMLGLSPLTHGEDGVDGKSLVPILEGEDQGAKEIEDRPLFWHFPHYSNHGAQSPGGAVRYGDYKLIEYYENNKVQLFNLKEDPGEQHDLAASNPAKVNELRTMLHEWRKKVDAEMPVPNPDYNPKLTWSPTSLNNDD